MAIPVIQTNNIEKSADFQHKVGGIAKGSEAYIFNILRNDLYSDKIGSLLREYLVNALDEHKKHNVQRPIRVTFPNSLQPTFKVRDFAAGLDKAGIFKYFVDYGSSDKRESNETVGFYGIGSKSAFCYTESFEIISYLNGKKLSFIHVINEKGLNELNFIGSETTYEPNGVEVIIPVQSWDVQEFVDKGKNLIKWFKSFPEIEGLAEEWNITELKPEPLLQGSNWKLLVGSQPYAVMGEVAYPINFYSIGNREQWETELLRGELVLNFNIGDLQVTASREELQMTPDTVKKIHEALAVVKLEMSELLKQRFNNVKNLVEAKSLYWEMFMTGNMRSLFKNILPEVEFNGEILRDNEIPLLQNNQSIGRIMVYDVKKARKYPYKKTLKYSESGRLLCKQNLELFLDDTNGKKNDYKRRALTLVNEGADQVQILQVRNTQAFADLGLDLSTLKSYNDVVPTIVSSNKVGGEGVDEEKRKKHTRKEFVFDRNCYSNYASDSWSIAEVTEEGLFIPIHRFKPESRFATTPSELKNFLSTLENVGVNILPVYGVKKGTENTFDDWVIEQLKGLDTIELSLYTEYINGDFDDDILDFTAPEGSLLREYQDLFKAAKDLSFKQCPLKGLFERLDLEIPVSTRLTEIRDQTSERYPMVSYLVENCYSINNDTRLDDYILEQDIKFGNSVAVATA